MLFCPFCMPPNLFLSKIPDEQAKKNMDMKIITLILLLLSMNSIAQLNERFDDGNYTINPQWKGDTASWKINAGKELQSKSAIPNDIFYLSTENKRALVAEWRFNVLLNFNTSSANYVDVYLMASSENLKQSDLTGYFIRMGNSNDEISLYRKEKQNAVKIIDGKDGVLNSSNSNIFITVKRDKNNNWQLFRKINQNEEILEGMATDTIYQTSSFFGILVKQSTASFFGKHFFDDIQIQELLPDTSAPQILSVYAKEENSLDIFFNEPIDKESAQLVGNYIADHSLFMPVNAMLDSSNSKLVHLKYGESFPARTLITITVNGIKDLSGNVLIESVKTFTRYRAEIFDIVIDEIMADPDPIVGIPNAEWIELKNTSSFDINLKGWKIAKPSSSSSPLPEYILKPGEFVILCSSSAADLMSSFINVLPVTSLPSLSNAGDLIYLLSPEGKVIHAVNYSDKWYNNALKKNGGWSLEMKDTNNPCIGSDNWSAANEISGGTPGSSNSINSANLDTLSPKILHAFAEDSTHITLYFNEPMDSLRATNIHSYNIGDNIGKPLRINAIPPLFDKVNLELQSPLIKGKIYTITINEITDCVQNKILSNSEVFVGLEEPADSIDIVINEILFNPKTDGADYVEIYNRSNKIINLKKISIGGINTAGEMIQINYLLKDNYLFFPGEYAVFTEDPASVQHNYWVKNPATIFSVDELPSMSDDEGKIVLLNEQGRVIDKLFYKDDWHFKLLNNTESISLERINFNAPTQNEQNWHSASDFAGYGTPGYQNSQYKNQLNDNNDIRTNPEIFSPDNDGRDDFLTINYQFDEPGYVANIVIYDAVGRVVRSLQRSALCGIKGFYKWDGLNDKYQSLPQGIYIVYTEVFNLQGKIKKYKRTVVLAKEK